MKLIGVVLAMLLASPACGPDATSPPPETVEGVVVEVTQDGTAVASFELEADGVTHVYRIDPQIDYGFDLLHLNEHAETRDPVVVRSETRDGSAYATSIEDA